MRYFLGFGLIMLVSSFYAQSGVVVGKVVESPSNEALPFVKVQLDSTSYLATTDLEGEFRIEGVAPGTYNITFSFSGYNTVTKREILVSSVGEKRVDVSMTEQSDVLDELVVKANVTALKEDELISVQNISAAEIYRNPGGNRDISKVISILPGVASTAAFRNDLIVRGGAPNENRFYLDGIEVPNINHFATQGSSGGPVGMINVNFVQDVNFYTGAFPSNRGNALSSVMELTQIEGGKDGWHGNFMVGSSDVGLTLNGPTSKKSTLLLSARRSYLQFLFRGLGLPFLPTYNDFQLKEVINVNDKNKITIIGLGAIDDFELNTSVNDGITDSADLERNNYILGNLPVNTQWNYTIGGKWTHFRENSFQDIVISRNHLNNQSTKYQDNIQDPANLILDYKSQEVENKFRFENTYRKKGWKINAGVGLENINYTNDSYVRREIGGVVLPIEVDSKLSFEKFAVFGQASQTFLKNRLQASLGLRSDWNNYSSNMNNPLEQISPTLSLAYSLSETVKLNAAVGRFHQLPAYTVLGYRDANGTLSNQITKYIRSDQVSGGVVLFPKDGLKISLEGFAKVYSNYPFLIGDSISLANLGGDFGVIGNEPVSSISSGRSVGVEFFAQQRLTKWFYGLISYTYVKSEFEDKNGSMVSSSWDNRHVLNVTAGFKLKKDWEIGAKFRLLGGAPYTPFDLATSSLIPVWDVTGQGILDWNQLNTLRNPVNHGLDIRIDKKWYKEKTAFNLYLDVQNVYNYQYYGPSFINTLKDGNGDPVVSSTDPSRYEMVEVSNVSGTVLPSIGIMIEF